MATFAVTNHPAPFYRRLTGWGRDSSLAGRPAPLPRGLRRLPPHRKREEPPMTSRKYENLVEMFQQAVKTYGSRDLFGTKKNGSWSWTSYAAVSKLIDQLRGGLTSLGIKKGDCVAIISNNRVEWAVAAYACYG